MDENGAPHQRIFHNDITHGVGQRHSKRNIKKIDIVRGFRSWKVKAAAPAFFKRATMDIFGFIIQPGVMHSKGGVQNGPGTAARLPR